MEHYRPTRLDVPEISSWPIVIINRMKSVLSHIIPEQGLHITTGDLLRRKIVCRIHGGVIVSLYRCDWVAANL